MSKPFAFAFAQGPGEQKRKSGAVYKCAVQIGPAGPDEIQSDFKSGDPISNRVSDFKSGVRFQIGPICCLSAACMADLGCSIPISHDPACPEHSRHQANPPLWAESEMHQPILGLDTAPRPLRLMVWACLDRPAHGQLPARLHVYGR